MTDSYLQFRRIAFSGPKSQAGLDFRPGVNVICGASDTGKSFLAESLDFMLGGSTLKEIPERTAYAEIALELASSEGDDWILKRATTGGDFELELADRSEDSSRTILKQKHLHGRTDNVSGFLLEKIGLLNKRILKSSRNASTQSLSFRNLARLVIVQETEIQQIGSPFWGGQYTLKTAELATIKLLLTGIDDSGVISAPSSAEADVTKQVNLIDELRSDVLSEIEDLGHEEDELEDQLSKLERSIDEQKKGLDTAQEELDRLLVDRRKLFDERSAIQGRVEEIEELRVRFGLLHEHYEIDLGRLAAIRESGSLLIHVEQVPCPLCGAPPQEQHQSEECAGDIDSVVQAAGAEIKKIQRLMTELDATVGDLEAETEELGQQASIVTAKYDELDVAIREKLSPDLGDARATFVTYVEERARVRNALNLFERAAALEERKSILLADDDEHGHVGTVEVGLPESAAHALSMKLEEILRAWNFPGDCHVHFDKETSDFVIDGKPRGSRGKGLRAITHAAVTIGLLEYCQEQSLPHPGFVVLDSPLLAYFKPEGDEDRALQGTDLKERFYDYLIQHHGDTSQVVIIENQHPPEAVQDQIALTIFTRNPGDGRYGFL